MCIRDRTTENSIIYKKPELKDAPQIGLTSPNEFGVCDMRGLIWEWVEDCYTDNFKQIPTDGTAYFETRSKNRTIKGGSWAGDEFSVSSSSRGSVKHNNKLANLGFRLASSTSSIGSG